MVSGSPFEMTRLQGCFAGTTKSKMMSSFCMRQPQFVSVLLSRVGIEQGLTRFNDGEIHRLGAELDFVVFQIHHRVG